MIFNLRTNLFTLNILFYAGHLGLLGFLKSFPNEISLRSPNKIWTPGDIKAGGYASMSTPNFPGVILGMWLDKYKAIWGAEFEGWCTVCGRQRLYQNIPLNSVAIVIAVVSFHSTWKNTLHQRIKFISLSLAKSRIAEGKYNKKLRKL